MDGVIKISSLRYAVFAVMCAVATNLVNVGQDYSAYKWLSIIILVEVVIFVKCNKEESGNYLNFATIFVILMCLFNFGQVFLLGFFTDFLVEKTVVLKYFSCKDGYYALKWVNYSFLIISVMILENTRPQLNKKIENTKEFLFQMQDAKLLIICTFPIKLFIDINFWIKAVSVGFEYGKSWLNSFPNFIVTIGNLSVIGFAYMIVLLYKDKPRQMGLFVACIIYLLLLMISGRRSESVSYLCIIGLLFLSSRENLIPNKRNIISTLSVCLFGYFILIFLYTIVHVRNSTNNSLGFIFERMWYYHTHENIIIETIREYGQTGYTAICVINNYLPRYGPSYGTSYLLGISSIFPNIGGVMGILTEKSTFGLTIAKIPGVLHHLYTNIGGNMIGEFFFNFGKIGGLLFSAIIGRIIGMVNTKAIIGLRSKSCDLIYMVPVMFYTLYWIRDYFGDSIRDILWGILACYIIEKIDLN